jgi:LysM repeat protein
MIHAATTLTTVGIHREAAARPPAHVVVRPGDTLSEIARKYHIEWPGLYEANRAVIGADPDILRAGQHLRIPSRTDAARLARRFRPAPVAVAPAASTQPAQAVADQVTAPASTGDYAAAPGSFQSCVIARESGGNSQVMNASGHYGLYQFSYSAWVAAGGSAADFGHASVAEQNQVFDTAYAEDGTSPWAPYDGC